MTSAFSWQNSISLFPASFRIPRPNLPATPGVSWLPTFKFQFLLLLISRESLNPFMVTSDPHDKKQKTKTKTKLLQNECFMVLNSPFTKTSYIDVSPLPFWSSLRPIWDTASQAAVHILPQVKLNSQLSNYSFFFFFFFLSRQLWWPWWDPEWTSFLQLNFTMNQSFGTSSGHLCPSTSSGSADEFG